MALCPVWTEKMVKVSRLNQDPATQKWDVKVVTPTRKTMLCGRKPAQFVRVHYKELHPYRRGEGKYDDLFGLCGEHASLLTGDVARFNVGGDRWRPGALSGLRGLVERAELVEVDPSVLAGAARQDKALRIMAAVKADFKRKMRQSNTVSLSVDHWRQLFEECIEEWVAEGVMES